PSGALLLLAWRGRRRLTRPAIATVARVLAGGPVTGGHARPTRGAPAGALRDRSGLRSPRGSRRRAPARRVRRRGGRLGRGQKAPDEELLPDRPHVRGDPVDDQAGREPDDDEGEDDREQEQEPALRLVLDVHGGHPA